MGEVLQKIKNQVCTNPNEFHNLVEALNAKPCTQNLAHKLLLEYYKVSPVTLQIEVCHSASLSSDAYRQTLELGLKQKHNHDIKLRLTGTTHSEPPLSGSLIFEISSTVTPQDNTVEIEQQSTSDSQVEIRWRNPYKAYAIRFDVNEVRDRTGPLENTIKCKPCIHKIPRLKENLIHEETLLMRNQRYRNKLKPDSKTCMALSRKYRDFIMDSDIDSSQLLTQDVETRGTLSPNERAYFLSYHGFLLAQLGHTDESIEHLEYALKLNQTHMVNDNYPLVQGRICRMLAKTYRTKQDYSRANDYIVKSFNLFQNAIPSNEVACAYLEYATLLQNSDNLVDRVQVRYLLEKAKHNMEKCEDTKRSQFMIPMVYIEMALFYTHSFDEATSNFTERPSKDDLENARRLLQHCEKRTADIQSKKGNAYLIRLNVALADLRFHEQNYAGAVGHMTEVERMLTESGGVDEHNLHIWQKSTLFKRMLDEATVCTPIT